MQKKCQFSKTASQKSELQQCMQEEQNLNFSRDKQKQALFGILLSQRFEVQKFKQKVKNLECMQSSEQMETLSLQSRMLEDKLLAFRERQVKEWDVLTDSEEDMGAFMQFFEENLERYEKLIEVNTNKVNKQLNVASQQQQQQKRKRKPHLNFQDSTTTTISSLSRQLFISCPNESNGDKQFQNLQENENENEKQQQKLQNQKQTQNQKYINEENDEEDDEQKENNSHSHLLNNQYFHNYMQINIKNDVASSTNEQQSSFDNIDNSLFLVEEQAKRVGALKTAKLEKEVARLKSEIGSIEQHMLKNGGRLCGWDAEDHDLFLKLKTKHNNKCNKPAFLNDCVSTLPLHTEEDVQEHIARCGKQGKLETEKKLLLGAYKETKDKLAKHLVEQCIKLKEQSQQQNNNHHKEDAKLKQKSQNDEKEELKRWKQERQARKELESEQQARIKHEQTLKEQQQMLQRKEHATIVLQEYKQLKELERIKKEEQLLYQQSLQKHTLSKEELERLKQKEQFQVQKKVELHRQRMEQQELKQIKTQKQKEEKSIKFAYVQPRLNEETKAQLGKQNEKYRFKAEKSKFGNAETFGGQVQVVQTRAVPSWRQGL